MAFRIASSLAPKPIKAVKREPYLQWVRSLPCIVTGQIGVDAAHISTGNMRYGHAGRGKSQKADDRWALPVIRPEHDRQHGMNEMAYWRAVGINPYVAALVLHGMYVSKATPLDAATVMTVTGFGALENSL